MYDPYTSTHTIIRVTVKKRQQLTPKSGGELLTLFDSYSYDGVSAGIWVIHTGPKSGGELLTLFDSYSYDGVSAGIWVIHTGPKSGGELVTLFDSYSDDGVSAV